MRRSPDGREASGGMDLIIGTDESEPE
jgi:hypothetical protein